jgi:hypothetical protein
MPQCCYALSFMLTVLYAECHQLALCAECHYAECHYAECRGAIAMTQVSMSASSKHISSKSGLPQI